MKTLILHGVPYNVNDANQVFLYTKKSSLSPLPHSKGAAASSSSAAAEDPLGEEPQVQVGTYSPSTGTLSLFSDWEARSAAFLTSYRTTLLRNTEEALEKARILQTS